MIYSRSVVRVRQSLADLCPDDVASGQLLGFLIYGQVECYFIPWSELQLFSDIIKMEVNPLLNVTFCCVPQKPRAAV